MTFELDEVVDLDELAHLRHARIAGLLQLPKGVDRRLLDAFVQKRAAGADLEVDDAAATVRGEELGDRGHVGAREFAGEPFRKAVIHAFRSVGLFDHRIPSRPATTGKQLFLKDRAIADPFLAHDLHQVADGHGVQKGLDVTGNLRPGAAGRQQQGNGHKGGLEQV